eukprot:2938037-Karenia_brevis.AAC.1
MHVPCAPAASGEQGHTWLEIMLLSMAWGAEQRSTSSAATQISISRRLRAFQSGVWQVLQLLMVPHSTSMFKVAPRGMSRLACYGFTSHHAHTCCCFQYPQLIQNQLNLVILNMTSSLTKAQVEQLQHGRLYVKPSAFKGHGTIKSHAQLRQLRILLQQSFSTRCVEYLPSANTTLAHTLFHCPYGHGKEALRHFVYLDLGRSVWCQQCKRAFTSTQWSCPCNLLWHHCPTHFIAASAHTPLKRTSSNVSPMSAEVAAKRLKLLQPQSSTLKLGPLLSAKFPHLAES